MPISVPTADEFDALKAQVNDLEHALATLDARVAALEQDKPPPDTGDGGGDIDPPPDGTMVATITMPQQNGALAQVFIPAGTYEFREADGQQLQNWFDPRGQFLLYLTQCTNAALPGWRVIFVRSDDDAWASVEVWFGDSTTANSEHCNMGYTLSVAGDFSGEAATPNHWWGARWRVSGNAANGLRPGRNDWPYALTDYGTLVDERLIPRFDPTLTNPRVQLPQRRPYTPMGNSTLAVGMPNTGGRPDIGLFNGWACVYFLSQAPNASPEWQAAADDALLLLTDVAEAGASIPWFLFDAPKGHMWENVVDYAGRNTSTPYSQRGGFPAAPGAGAAPVGATMELIATGPPGATIANANGPIVTDDWGQQWYVRSPNDPGTIPESGSAVLHAHFPNLWRMPSPGDAKWPGNPAGDPAITYTWGDPASFQGGTPWGITISHGPEVSYLSYLLFRDPWDLHSTQANYLYTACLWPAFSSYAPNPTEGTVRAMAWHYRNCLQGTRITPDDAPSWLVPRSTCEKYLQIAKDWLLTYDVNGGAAMNTKGCYRDVFNIATVAEPPNIPLWQESFLGQVSAFGAVIFPEDPDIRAIADWAIQCESARYSGTSGWPNGACCPYQWNSADASGGPYYASWAEAWEGNRQLWWNWQSGNKPPDPLPPDPVDVNMVTQGNGDYSSGDLAALAIAAQIGCGGDAVTMAYDWLRSCVLPAIPAGNWFNRAFAGGQ